MDRWFNKLVGDGGLLNVCGKSDDSTYICQQIKNEAGDIFRRFRKFNSIVNFYDYMLDVPKYKRCFFEVILGERFQKPYFDIDIDKNLPDLGHTLLVELRNSILYDKRIRGMIFLYIHLMV